MTESARERQRIVAIIEELKSKAIRDYWNDRQNDSDLALALIGTYQECIDKIMETDKEATE